MTLYFNSQNHHQYDLHEDYGLNDSHFLFGIDNEDHLLNNLPKNLQFPQRNSSNVNPEAPNPSTKSESKEQDQECFSNSDIVCPQCQKGLLQPININLEECLFLCAPQAQQSKLGKPQLQLELKQTQMKASAQSQQHVSSLLYQQFKSLKHTRTTNNKVNTSSFPLKDDLGHASSGGIQEQFEVRFAPLDATASNTFLFDECSINDPLAQESFNYQRGRAPFSSSISHVNLLSDINFPFLQKTPAEVKPSKTAETTICCFPLVKTKPWDELDFEDLICLSQNVEQHRLTLRNKIQTIENRELLSKDECHKRLQELELDQHFLRQEYEEQLKDMRKASRNAKKEKQLRSADINYKFEKKFLNPHIPSKRQKTSEGFMSTSSGRSQDLREEMIEQ